MKKLTLLLTLVMVLFFSVPGFAQSVDVIYGAGKGFDIPSASFMTFHVPALEVAAKGLVVNIARQFDSNLKKSETDISATYGYQLTERLKLSISGIELRYHMPFIYGENRKRDWRIWTEARYKLKK